jgi:hypothetical protein
MKKIIEGNQRDWDNWLQEALWYYRTAYWTPTQAKLYSLAFGGWSCSTAWDRIIIITGDYTKWYDNR